MKIFPKESPVIVNRPEKAEREGKISRKKAPPPVKKEISAAEIKEKLAAHVTTSEAAKNMAIKNTQKLGENFLSDKIKSKLDEVRVDVPKIAPIAEEEIKTPNTKDLTIKSDVALNDPNDTNTQEKLKTILSKGAFNFNPKEREALDKILSGS